jgi:hypothetical protein
MGVQEEKQNSTAILSIAQIIKFVMALAAESELAVLFITAREMIPHHQTLNAMGWPQPKSPIQMDKSTAVGITNKTIVPRKAKMMDMGFWWLHCHASQDQFCYYWDAGSKNWADNHTKLNPDTYDKAHRSWNAGYWSLVSPQAHPQLTPTHKPTGFPLQIFPFSFFP